MAQIGPTYGRNLVVASVQSSTDIYPQFQSGPNVPTYRPNGGDLIGGDTWYHTHTKTLYLYTGEEWIAIGGQGLYDEIYETIENLEERINNIEEKFPASQ